MVQLTSGRFQSAQKLKNIRLNFRLAPTIIHINTDSMSLVLPWSTLLVSNFHNDSHYTCTVVCILECKCIFTRCYAVFVHIFCIARLFKSNAVCIDYRLRKRLHFLAEYDIRCSYLNDAMAYSVLLQSTELTTEIELLCSGGKCRISSLTIPNVMKRPESATEYKLLLQ